MNSDLQPTTPDAEIPAVPPGVRITTLDNGLTIIVREDHSAPVVAVQAWCKAGSIHEGKWLGAGLSHVLEHMLFKGTTTRGAGRIDQEVQDAGGYMNAYTSFDRTVYHINVPNTGARVAVDILCDIMQHATLPPDELAKEMDVIRREMDMNQDDPGRRSSRRLFETAYTQSSYRLTVIGYPDIFNELKPEDIRNYYHEKYAPNNLFYVVVGDIRPDEVVAQIRECFSKTRARAIPPAFLPAEPTQTAPREVIEHAPVELAHFHLSWHIPDVRHADVPALDVLSGLVGSGRSSRLYREIREIKGLVTSVDSWTYSPGNPGLFGVSASCEWEKFARARDAIALEIARLQTDIISSAELDKTKKQFLTSTLSTRKTMQGQAQDLGGNWIAASDLNFSERYLAAVNRVTPDDLQRVARRYLTPTNRSLYALLPDAALQTQCVVSEVAGETGIHKFELAGGLRLLVREDHRLPFVHFRVVFRGGIFAETKDTNGATQLMSRLMQKGTVRRTADQIATEIESIGGSLDTYGGNNSFGISAEVLREDFVTGLDLVADVVRNPILPAAAFAREQEIQISQIRSQNDHLLSSAFRLLKQTLFGDTGYGLDALGTESAVAKLNVDKLKTLFTDFAVPNNCVISVFGDIEAGQVRREISKALAGWNPNSDAVSTLQSRIRELASSAALPLAARVTTTRDKKQAVVVCGFRATTIFHADHYALEIIEEACSDLGSRLFLRIREKLGLAYYVGAQNFSGLTPGYFAFYAGTDPEKAALVEESLRTEIAQLASDGLSLEEITRSKAKLTGQKKIARQDLGGLATNAALDELHGLGFEHAEKETEILAAVTAEQIQAVCAKYFRPNAAVVVLISPAGM